MRLEGYLRIGGIWELEYLRLKGIGVFEIKGVFKIKWVFENMSI